ncbi:GUN4 domain-containing protein [Microcoleus sp. ZQ-A2]
MSNKPNQSQTNDAVLGGQLSLASLSHCPVCKTEYTYSEVNCCSLCNWDLTACPEAFLDRQNIQVAWARDMWVKLQTQEKQLHIKINAEIDANPQLSELRAESNLEIWDLLITWIYGIDLDAAKIAVRRLQGRYQEKEPRQIARILIVHKSFQAAGVELVRGIPGVDEILNGWAGVDFPVIAKLAAEMIYQIAAIYGLDLQDPERRLEVLATFGIAFLGERAIETGIDWLKYGLMPGQLISAGAKGLMIFALGNAACLFYEAKVNQHINPLNSPEALNELWQESQDYLKDATSEDEIIDIISFEIETTPIKILPSKPVKTPQGERRAVKPTKSVVQTLPRVPLSTDVGADYTRLRDLLASGKWREADLETRRVMLWVARRTKKGWFRDQDILRFPCTDLRTIDQLWLQRSGGCFGFSVQKRIYEELGESTYELEERVGWLEMSYDELTFERSAPDGHLPAAVEKKNGRYKMWTIDMFGYPDVYLRWKRKGGVNVGAQQYPMIKEWQNESVLYSLLEKIVACRIG